MSGASHGSQFASRQFVSRQLTILPLRRWVAGAEAFCILGAIMTEWNGPDSLRQISGLVDVEALFVAVFTSPNRDDYYSKALVTQFARLFILAFAAKVSWGRGRKEGVRHEMDISMSYVGYNIPKLGTMAAACLGFARRKEDKRIVLPSARAETLAAAGIDSAATFVAWSRAVAADEIRRRLGPDGVVEDDAADAAWCAREGLLGAGPAAGEGHATAGSRYIGALDMVGFVEEAMADFVLKTDLVLALSDTTLINFVGEIDVRRDQPLGVEAGVDMVLRKYGLEYFVETAEQQDAVGEAEGAAAAAASADAPAAASSSTASSGSVWRLVNHGLEQWTAPNLACSFRVLFDVGGGDPEEVVETPVGFYSGDLAPGGVGLGLDSCVWKGGGGCTAINGIH